jgi:hypothetical protein
LAPLASLSLAEQEHGRTIPLADISALLLIVPDHASIAAT